MSIAPLPTDAPRHMRRRIDALREAERRQTRRPGDPIPTPKPEPIDWHGITVGLTLALAVATFVGWVGTALMLDPEPMPTPAPTGSLTWNPDARLDSSQVTDGWTPVPDRVERALGHSDCEWHVGATTRVRCADGWTTTS